MMARTLVRPGVTASRSVAATELQFLRCAHDMTSAGSNERPSERSLSNERPGDELATITPVIPNKGASALLKMIPSQPSLNVSPLQPITDAGSAGPAHVRWPYS
jgi:hypothetical protein